MIADCRARLEKTGYGVQSRVLMTGFSASGTFVNRFANVAVSLRLNLGNK